VDERESASSPGSTGSESPPPLAERRRTLGAAGVFCPLGHRLECRGVTPDEGWICDGHRESGGCRRGVADGGGTQRVERYSCRK
jgi:hypothetical protein